MSDEEKKKGVTVVANIGTSRNAHNYPDGQKIDFRDGHLMVYSSADGTIAIYAPGKWVTATYTS